MIDNRDFKSMPLFDIFNISQTVQDTHKVIIAVLKQT